MTARRPTRRRGVSLTEVLVALFVMALGMIALLTLFPLGAMQIGQALKDDRTAQTAAQADAYLREYWRHAVVEAVEKGAAASPAGPLPTRGLPDDDAVWAGQDPNLLWRGATTATTPTAGPVYVDEYVSPLAYGSGGALLPSGFALPPAGSDVALPPSLVRGTYRLGAAVGLPPALEAGANRYVTPGGRSPAPSYPVLVDPLGWLARGTGTKGALAQHWVAGQYLTNSPPAVTTWPTPLIPRRTLGKHYRRVGGQEAGRPAAQRALGGRGSLFPGYPTTAPQWDQPIGPGALAVDPRLYDLGVFTTSSQSALERAFQATALTDDLTFQDNGGANQRAEPGAPAPGLNRQGRYTWAALIQRPRDDMVTTASLTVLVFNDRPPGLANPTDEVVADLTGVAAPDGSVAGVEPLRLGVGSRQVVVLVPPRAAEEGPLVRRGGWLLDGTIQPPTPAVPAGIRNGSFYRITAVTELAPAQPVAAHGVTRQYGLYALDLETPIKPLPGAPTVTSYPGQVYFFAGLSEVFERPRLEPDPAY